MFGGRFFGHHYFGYRYFAEGGGASVPPSTSLLTLMLSRGSHF